MYSLLTILFFPKFYYSTIEGLSRSNFLIATIAYKTTYYIIYQVKPFYIGNKVTILYKLLLKYIKNIFKIYLSNTYTI